MSLITLNNKTFKQLFSEEEIKGRIGELAEQIEKSISADTLLLSVLNGSILFTADLIRNFKHQYQIDFIRLSSYEGTESTGSVKEVLGLFEKIEGRKVLIIEDIVDTGETLAFLEDFLLRRKADAVQTVSLLHKRSNQKKGNTPDFVGFNIPDLFVLGYGLDYNGLGRGFSNIYQLHLD